MRLAEDLRAAVLQAAIEGKLTSRDSSDTPPTHILTNVKAKKEDLRKRKLICKDKPLIKLSDEVSSISLPAEWNLVNLQDISTQITDGEHKTPKRVQAFCGYYLLSARNVTNNGIRLDDVDYVDEDEYKKISVRCNPERDDILISCSGSVGRACVVQDDNCYVMVRSAAMVRCPDALPGFVCLAIRSPFVQGQIEELKKQSVQANLFQGAIASLLIPLPPFEEQQRIVDRINELMPVIDEYEAMENQLVALKERFPTDLQDAILQAAVLGKLTDQNTQEESELLVKAIRETKKKQLTEKTITKDNSCKTKPIEKYEDELPELPANWTWIRLGDLCSKIGAGSTPAGGSKVYVNSGIKFLREQNVHNTGLIMDGLVYISEEINASMRGSQVQAKDILVNITGASIGRNALVPDDFDLANVNQHVLIVRMIDERLRHYIHLCLQSPFVFNQMMDKQMGDKPGLSATKVANFVIPIPPLEEQQRIVDRLNAILPLCNELAVD